MTAQASGHRHAIGEAEVGALVPGLRQGHRGNTGLKGGELSGLRCCPPSLWMF